MDPKDVERFRHLLLQQRQTVLREISNVEEDLSHVSEAHGSEFEEQAQEERATQLLARLDEREKKELANIDRALARLDAQQYGICTGCGSHVRPQRLAALPTTPYCRDCAAVIERAGAADQDSVESKRRAATLPPEYSLLTDRELEEAIRDRLQEDDRIDFEEFRILCRHGVVYLDGAVPSEAEHQIVLRTLTDVMGLPEIVDRLDVVEILWERDDRNKPEVSPEPAPWEEPAGTTHIVAAIEEESEFVAPTEPGPDGQ